MLFLAKTNSTLNTTVASEDEEEVVLLSLSKKDINLRGNVRPIWRSALELAFYNFGAQVRREECRCRFAYFMTIYILMTVLS